jgi:large subunit ribosomal protein L10
MALTRVKKAEKVAQLTKELEGSTSAIVGTFAKLTVAQDFALRSVVRTAGGRYRVLKNKLAARASKGSAIEGALQGLKGVSSVAYTSGDPVALAKALSAWVKENAEFTFKLGIVDGKVITVEEVNQLATMPGKEELYAKLLYLINAPAQRLVTVMNATGRDLAVVINQAVEKEKFSAAPAAAAKTAVAAAVEPTPQEAAPASEASAVEASAPEALAPAAAMETASAVEATAPNVEAAPVVEAATAEAAQDEPTQAEAAATEAPAEGAPAEASTEPPPTE